MIVSPSTSGPFVAAARRVSIASRPVTCALTPGGALAVQRALRRADARVGAESGRPGREISAKVVWLSFETYGGLPVVKYELERAPDSRRRLPRSPP